MTVVTISCCGSETWPLQKCDLQKIQTIEMKFIGCVKSDDVRICSKMDRQKNTNRHFKNKLIIFELNDMTKKMRLNERARRKEEERRILLKAMQF